MMIPTYNNCNNSLLISLFYPPAQRQNKFGMIIYFPHFILTHNLLHQFLTQTSGLGSTLGLASLAPFRDQIILVLPISEYYWSTLTLAKSESYFGNL